MDHRRIQPLDLTAVQESVQDSGKVLGIIVEGPEADGLQDAAEVEVQALAFGGAGRAVRRAVKSS